MARRRKQSAYERARSAPPGSGARFRGLVQDLKRRGYSEERARAIAASIGRRKYGHRRFQQMAARGRRRAARRSA